jgi:putative RNA 2'-phosphotransferase
MRFMDERLIRVSKYLAKYLRHSPHELGLTLRPGGWVPVDDLLAAAEDHGFKKRFSLDETGDLIRANQGHSVEVDLQLEERKPPEVLYHGTVAERTEINASLCSAVIRASISRR